MKANDRLNAVLREKWRRDKTAASALGVSPACVSDILAGRRRISVSIAQQVEVVLDKPGLARELLVAQVDDDLESID